MVRVISGSTVDSVTNCESVCPEAETSVAMSFNNGEELDMTTEEEEKILFGVVRCNAELLTSAGTDRLVVTSSKALVLEIEDGPKVGSTEMSSDIARELDIEAVETVGAITDDGNELGICSKDIVVPGVIVSSAD